MPKTEIRGPWPYEINPGPRVVTRRLLTQPILDYLKKHPGGHISKMSKDLGEDSRSVRRRVWKLAKKGVLYPVDTVAKNGRKVAGFKVNV